MERRASGQPGPAYAGLGLTFALTTDRIRMVKSFQRQFHLPQVFAYGLLAAWGGPTWLRSSSVPGLLSEPAGSMSCRSLRRC